MFGLPELHTINPTGSPCRSLKRVWLASCDDADVHVGNATMKNHGACNPDVFSEAPAFGWIVHATASHMLRRLLDLPFISGCTTPERFQEVRALLLIAEQAIRSLTGLQPAIDLYSKRCKEGHLSCLSEPVRDSYIRCGFRQLAMRHGGQAVDTRKSKCADTPAMLDLIERYGFSVSEHCAFAHPEVYGFTKLSMKERIGRKILMELYTAPFLEGPSLAVLMNLPDA